MRNPKTPVLASLAESPTSDSPIDVVAAVLERRGRLLLAQRPRQKAHGGLWEFPGGKVDEGESLAAALQRELNEELALSSVEVGPELFEQRDNKLCLHFFAVTTNSAPIALEHMSLGWFQPNEARLLDLAPVDRAFLSQHGDQLAVQIGEDKR